MKLATNFKDFPALTTISRTFKALNFSFEIQGLSRRERTLKGEIGKRYISQQHLLLRPWYLFRMILGDGQMRINL